MGLGIVGEAGLWSVVAGVHFRVVHKRGCYDSVPFDFAWQWVKLLYSNQGFERPATKFSSCSFCSS